jgi:hypothetical protein
MVVVFRAMEGAPDISWAVLWVGPGCGLDEVVKRKFPDYAASSQQFYRLDNTVSFLG